MSGISSKQHYHKQLLSFLRSLALEKSEKSEKNVKSEKSDESEKKEKNEKFEKSEKNGKTAKVEKMKRMKRVKIGKKKLKWCHRGVGIPQGYLHVAPMRVPQEVSLLFACAGIFFSFSYFAVLQEDVYKKPYGEEEERFKFTFLALAVERGINALIALLGVALLGSSRCKIPHTQIFMSGISQMLAMAGSNESLRYVSFATQVCCTPFSRPPPPMAHADCHLMTPHAVCSGVGEVVQNGPRDAWRPDTGWQIIHVHGVRASAHDYTWGLHLQLWWLKEGQRRQRLFLWPGSDCLLSLHGCGHWWSTGQGAPPV